MRMTNIRGHEGEPGSSRLVAFLEKRAIWVVVLAPVLAKLHLLVGLLNPNPLFTVAWLAVDGVVFRSMGQPTIDPNIGFTSQALGHRAALDLISGVIPWWNYFEGAGGPLAGEMNSAALFPPTLLLYFSDGQLWMHIVLPVHRGVVHPPAAAPPAPLTAGRSSGCGVV